MQYLSSKYLGLLLLLGMLACQPWDLDEISFPEVHTREVAEKTYTSARIRGEILGLAGELSIIEHGFVWSDSTTSPTIEDRVARNGGRKNNGEFILELTDLTLNTEYYLRAFAELESGIIYEEDVLAFTPTMLDLTISMDSIRKSTNEVLLYGAVAGIQPGVEIISHGHVWSTETNWPTIDKDNAVFSGVIAGDQVLVESRIENLEPFKEYHVRTFIISGSRAIYSAETISFTKGDIWIEKSASPLEFPPSIYPHDFRLEQDTTIYFFRSSEVLRYFPNDRVERQALPANDIGVAATFVIGARIYLVNEFNGETWVYDTENSRLTNLFDENGEKYRFPGGSRRGMQGFAINGRGYAGYGLSPGTQKRDLSFYEFDPDTGWTKKVDSFPDMPTRRDEKIIGFRFKDRACFGMGVQGVHTDFWCYEPTDDAWVSMPPLPIGAASATFNFRAFTIGEKGFLLLPRDNNNFWEFDNTLGKWTLRADYPGGQNANFHFSSNRNGYIGTGNTYWEYLPESAN